MKQRTTLVALVAAGLLAASAVGATAQSEEPGTMDPAFFTGVIDHDGAENPSWAEGILRDATCGPDGPPLNTVADDLYVGSIIETTDPRMSGSREVVLSMLRCMRDDGPPLAFLVDATFRITNDAGSWIGSGPGYITIDDRFVGGQLGDDPQAGFDGFMAELTGTGAYEGLTAVIHQQREAREGQEQPWEDIVRGVIMPGAIPPTSDFEGSADARAALLEIEEGSQDDEDFGEDFPESSGLAIPLGEAAGVVAAMHGDSADGGADGPFETLADLIEGSESGDAEMVSLAEQATEQLGISPADVEIYGFGAGHEVDGGDWQDFFWGTAWRFNGADPDALRTVMHPDGTTFLSLGYERPPGTAAEELQMGDHLVYRIWTEGEPVYVLIEGDAVVEVVGPEDGAGPDEAALEVFFENLSDLAEA